MTIARTIHEGGLSATSSVDSLEILQALGLRPVLEIRTLPGGGGPVDLVLSPSGICLTFQASELYSSPHLSTAILMKTLALAYDVGAALHHLANLARAYESIVVHHQRIRTRRGAESESGFSSFGYQVEPYYEFDALVSAGRRAYDKIARCIWQLFEGGGPDMPDNFLETVERIKHCPEPLTQRLRESWNRVGDKLKDYRDCTQHFVSVDLGLGTVRMQRVKDGTWKVVASIPDNPEAKSRNKFKFTAGHDALTYGWDVVNEVISLATEVVAAKRV